MMEDFTHATLGHTGTKVHRLGLSATYRPGKDTIHKALDEGMNYFFAYGFDSQMTKTLREIGKTRRESFVIATGAYNLYQLGHTDLRKTLEKRLRQLDTDYIDVFMFLGVSKEKHFPEKLRTELNHLREEGKVRAVSISCHDRKFAGKLVENGELDVIMARYNAAHRGAEEDIFPYLAKHNTGLVSYTATRWGYLIRRMGKWPQERPIPTPGMCYRFVLTNPHVDVCLTAPSNIKHLTENINSLKSGPLSPEEMAFIKEYGDMVHHTKKWFM
jgi:aryl-alcohol dehydrogenase-like predicted oxidoreductase